MSVPYASVDHTYVHQQPKMVFNLSDAFTQLLDTVVAELEYLSARGQTLDWWSLNEDGEPKFLTTPPFAELYRRLHGVVLDWPEADRADYKNTACLEWNEFLGQEFDIEDYLAVFPTAGEEADAVVKNVFLRLWHNDLYKFRQEMYEAHTRFGEKSNKLELERGSEQPPTKEEKAIREEADLFWKKAQNATKRLRELGKICLLLASPPAVAYFISIVEERKVAVVLKTKTETDLAEALYRVGFLNMNPAEALNRLYSWDEMPKNPATKKVIIARILCNNFAFSYDVPENLW
uniref:Uncharacterized protein n=1 Tax=viral metagenome TaxID=1070528 RepID=A0A6C0BJA4_9ZZZZ